MSERVVIVTGGSRGLGAGIVASYLRSGDKVATCARTATEQIDAWITETGKRFLFQPADLSRIDVVIDLNLKGTIYMTRLASRRMLANRSGSIVNIPRSSDAPATAGSRSTAPPRRHSTASPGRWRASSDRAASP